jgi:hypothetical protein
MRPPFTGVYLDLSAGAECRAYAGPVIASTWRDDPLTLCIYNQGWCTTPCIARPGESSTTDLLLAPLGEQIEVWRPDPRASVRMHAQRGITLFMNNFVVS